MKSKEDTDRKQFWVRYVGSRIFRMVEKSILKRRNTIKGFFLVILDIQDILCKKRLT